MLKFAKFIDVIDFSYKSSCTQAASLNTYFPCGGCKDGHNGSSRDCSASSTSECTSFDNSLSTNNLSVMANTSTYWTASHPNEDNHNIINKSQHRFQYAESPGLSPVNIFQLSTITKARTKTIYPTTSITHQPSFLLQPVLSVTRTQAATNTLPRCTSSSSYLCSSEMPLDMSKTSQLYAKSAKISNTPSTIIKQQRQQEKFCSIHAPPSTTPENDIDKFRCLYLLVDAAMERLDKLAAEERI